MQDIQKYTPLGIYAEGVYKFIPLQGFARVFPSNHVELQIFQIPRRIKHGRFHVKGSQANLENS